MIESKFNEIQTMKVCRRIRVSGTTEKQFIVDIVV